MKKFALLLLALTLSLGVVSGTALADDSKTKLEENVDKLIGTKYVYGGMSTKGFDCSGFTSYVFDLLGFDLNRSSRDQAKQGSKVAKSDLRPGDLVFFETGGNGISHVGIYLGDDVFVHSASDKGVMRNKLSEKYYTKRYVTARRIMTDEQYNDIAK